MPRAIRAPRPVNMPTRPASCDVDELETSGGAPLALVRESCESCDGDRGKGDCERYRAGVMVISDETDGLAACPFSCPLSLLTSGLCAGEKERSVIAGRMAVTIVEVAAPPKLKKRRARSNWGYTFFAWTKRMRDRPTMA